MRAPTIHCQLKGLVPPKIASSGLFVRTPGFSRFPASRYWRDPCGRVTSTHRYASRCPTHNRRRIDTSDIAAHGAAEGRDAGGLDGAVRLARWYSEAESARRAPRPFGPLAPHALASLAAPSAQLRVCAFPTAYPLTPVPIDTPRFEQDADPPLLHCTPWDTTSPSPAPSTIQSRALYPTLPLSHAPSAFNRRSRILLLPSLASSCVIDAPSSVPNFARSS
ncbi:hypothetical protein DFH09DRAFT_1339163 [Mycena vulgaris]|nr:hypothetical protein DFH09DRAFT_1339163 [Mycena vulgaris]